MVKFPGCLGLSLLLSSLEYKEVRTTMNGGEGPALDLCEYHIIALKFCCTYIYKFHGLILRNTSLAHFSL